MSKSTFIIIIITRILLLTLVKSNNNSINITCEHFNEFRTHIGAIPVCFVINNDSIVYDETYIISVSYNNKTLIKDTLTRHFATLNKVYYFMPQGLADIFDKLEGLELIQSKLRVVRLKDMQSLIHLVYLNLRQNELECIDGDVFTYNSNLKFVSLADNRIQRIDTRLFQTIPQAQQFFLNGNFCKALQAYNIYEIIILKKKKLPKFCSPLYDQSGFPMKCDLVAQLQMTKLKKSELENVTEADEQYDDSE